MMTDSSPVGVSRQSGDGNTFVFDSLNSRSNFCPTQSIFECRPQHPGVGRKNLQANIVSSKAVSSGENLSRAISDYELSCGNRNWPPSYTFSDINPSEYRYLLEKRLIIPNISGPSNFSREGPNYVESQIYQPTQPPNLNLIGQFSTELADRGKVTDGRFLYSDIGDKNLRADSGPRCHFFGGFSHSCHQRLQT